MTDPRPPRPWTNVIANERVGLAVSHTGSGFSWIDNSQLAAVTRWQQDLAIDRSGKFLYARDAEDGDGLVPLAVARVGAPRPLRLPPRLRLHESSRPRSTASTARWTLFCDAEATVELWKVELADASGRAAADRPRAASSSGAWASRPRRGASSRGSSSRPGMTRRAAPSSRATTCGTCRRRAGATGTRASRTSAPSRATEPLTAAQGDKAAFLGRFGDFDDPARCDRTTGRRSSAATRIRSRPCARRIELPAGRHADAGFRPRDRRIRRGGRGPRRPLLRASGRWTRPSRRSARAGGIASRRTAWRRPTPRSTRSRTTGSATRPSPRDSGRAAATTSRAAPSASATSSRTPRSG